MPPEKPLNMQTLNLRGRVIVSMKAEQSIIRVKMINDDEYFFTKLIRMLVGVILIINYVLFLIILINAGLEALGGKVVLCMCITWLIE